jgi:bifunctional DNase/RNase
MPEMVEVVIDSIRVSLMSQQRIVILRQVDAERYLPIWIGTYEAEAIKLSLQEVEVARPLTWDLLKNVFGALNGRVVRVEVIALKDDTFYGNIVVEADGKVVNIDSRPSDALALAVRAHVPILVATSIMDTAGITPEEDLQQEGAAPKTEKTSETEVEAGEERLSIFEDFLDKLDLDKLDKEDDDEEGKDKD